MDRLDELEAQSIFIFREAHARLVESGRSELTSILSEQLGEDEELAPVLRRVAASLVAEMPKE